MGESQFFALVLVLGLTAGCTAVELQNSTKPEPVAQLPRSEGTYLNMGRHLLRSNQPDLARDAFIRSIRTEGLSAEALTGAGLASERQGLMHDALRYFQHAANIAPSSVLAQNNLGAALYRLERFYEAKQAFQAAFALSSGKNRVAEHNLGLADLAIRREQNEGLALAPNPLPVVRLGSGEYTLPGPKQVEQDG